MNTFYVTGGWGYGNKGDNAIFEGMRQSLQKHHPDSKLLVTSYCADEMSEQHGLVAMRSVHRLLAKNSPLGVFRWLGVMIWRLSGLRFLPVPSLRQHLSSMREASVVVLGGGGYFNDAWPDMLRSRYVEFDLARAANTPVMLYGQTIGPFSDATIRSSLSKYLGRVAMIAYRDEQSLKVLKAAGVPAERRVYTADEANLLKPSSLAGERSGQRLLVGVMVQNFRPHLSHSGVSPAGCLKNGDDYFSVLVQTFLALAAKNELVDYSFIPSTEWDEPLCEKVFAAVNRQVGDRATMLRRPSARQFIDACQRVDLMISTNMHPVILAATASSPSVAISYHYKLDDYMASIGLTDFVVRIDDFSAETLMSKCITALASLDELGQRVATEHAVVATAAQRNMAALEQVLVQQRAD